MTVRIQVEAFDVARETNELLAGRPHIGALVSFTGYVRDENQLQNLILEHYPGMAESEICAIVQDAKQRWGLEAVRVVHRTGDLKPGEPIVWVAVASPHRGEAFAACEFIMDFLKTRAPFWKKEITRDGTARWLEAHPADEARLEKWR